MEVAGESMFDSVVVTCFWFKNGCLMNFSDLAPSREIMVPVTHLLEIAFTLGLV